MADPSPKLEPDDSIVGLAAVAGVVVLLPFFVVDRVLRLCNRRIFVSGIPKTAGGSDIKITLRPIRQKSPH